MSLLTELSLGTELCTLTVFKPYFINSYGSKCAMHLTNYVEWDLFTYRL